MYNSKYLIQGKKISEFYLVIIKFCRGNLVKNELTPSLCLASFDNKTVSFFISRHVSKVNGALAVLV